MSGSNSSPHLSVIAGLTTTTTSGDDSGGRSYSQHDEVAQLRAKLNERIVQVEHDNAIAAGVAAVIDEVVADIKNPRANGKRLSQPENTELRVLRASQVASDKLHAIRRHHPDARIPVISKDMLAKKNFIK